MKKVSFLKDYLIDQSIIENRRMKEVVKFKHYFFHLDSDDIQASYETFQPFPVELKVFYEEIGFGYFYCNKERVNRIFDPMTLVQVNSSARNKELDTPININRLVFFETFNGEHFSIQSEETYKGNEIYYKGKLVAESLEDFVYQYSQDRYYLRDIIKNCE